ncbi:MAG: hypothetical protein LBD50_02235 [Rickettsiales bacterium]|nr:hypothetical protein [Rickettsiales bacterium]
MSQFCKSGAYAGWSCSGYLAASSGSCLCSSYVSLYTPEAVSSVQNCGTTIWCAGRFVSLSCNTSGSAGYLINASHCACCPQGSGLNGIGSLYSDYNANASSQCYIVGEFSDDEGLFEYTNEDKCYYVS